MTRVGSSALCLLMHHVPDRSLIADPDPDRHKRTHSYGFGFGFTPLNLKNSFALERLDIGRIDMHRKGTERSLIVEAIFFIFRPLVVSLFLENQRKDRSSLVVCLCSSLKSRLSTKPGTWNIPELFLFT